MADITTSTLSAIPTEVFTQAQKAFMHRIPHFAQLGGEIIDVSFDGKGGKLEVPILPTNDPATSTLDESTGSNDTGSFDDSTKAITLAEYGDRVETVTGLAGLQYFDGNLTNHVLDAIAQTAAYTADYVVANNMVKKVGSGSSNSSTEDCKWEVLGPDSSDLPSSYLTSQAVDYVVANLKTKSEPFEDGFYRGIMPAVAVPSFLNQIRNNGESIADYAALTGMQPAAWEVAQGILGVWKGVVWKTTTFGASYNPYIISDGAAGGEDDAYKTLIFGKGYAAAGFCPVTSPTFPDNGMMTRIPLNKYVELRWGPDTSDTHGRNMKLTFYFYGGARVINNDYGLYLIHKADTKSYGN